MIAWMIYSALVALVVAAAARAAEWLARVGRYRVRWIWAGALALTVFLSATAVVRGTLTDALPNAGLAAIDLNPAARVRADATWWGALSVGIEHLFPILDAPLHGVIAAADRSAPPAANVYAVSLSLLMSFGVLVVVIWVASRFRSARRRWPIVTLQGVIVRVAPRVGPVVIGLVRPEIVVPHWLLARPADEQRLVVTHEEEHVRAGDPLLLGLAWATVIVAPWNPAVWQMLSRLRLAIELDCDARVLGRGAAPRSYGSLLIDVAQHTPALRLSVLALADDSSHLRQRILAITPSIPRFRRLRGALAAAFAVACILVACQAHLPSAATIDRMDGHRMEGTAATQRQQVTSMRADTHVSSIEGAKDMIAEVAALTPAAVATVRDDTDPRGKPTRINIERIKRIPTAAAADVALPLRVSPTRGRSAAEASAAPGSSQLPGATGALFAGLVFIDGVRATESQMRSLDRKRIESVDVLKGPFASQLYSDPEAANGVIAIKTRGSRTQ